MALNDVSTILWRERQMLELLLFKLEVEQLLLGAGRARWLAAAANEVESVLEEIKIAELARAVEVDAVAPSLGLGPDPSLSELAASAPEPWASILRDHREAFVVMAQEIMAVAESNRELLARGQRAVRETLAFIEGPTAETYSASGGRDGSTSRSLLVNETM